MARLLPIFERVPRKPRPSQVSDDGPVAAPLFRKTPWVPHPCGFQGAVFVPHLTNRRGSILITETTID